MLRALRAHDPELVSDATRIATSLGRRDAVVGGYISEHVQVLGAEVDVGRLEAALELRFVDVSADRWEVGIGHLPRFVEGEGHARVTAEVRQDGYPLGNWVSAQRVAYANGALGENRQRRLEDVVGWVWDAREANWRDGYDLLLDWVRRNGTARVPRGRRGPETGLSTWVGMQRSALASGRLSSERKELLEALPGWSWKPHEEAFREGLHYLRQYVAREGHARVSKGHQEGDFDLGSWVGRQRHRRTRARMSAGRVAVLEALPGWTWDPFEDKWTEGLRYLRRYAEREGSARVPGRHVEDGFHLGVWVTRQRSARGRATLTRERRAELEALPAWTWDPAADDWDRNFSALLAYASREGHARVPAGHVEDGIGLGVWVAYLRSLRKKGRLDEAACASLAAVPGWMWDPCENDFQEGLAHLIEFARREGHARPMRGHVEDGFKLGTWVAVQRRDARRRDDRRAALESVPGWTWDAYEADWLDGLQRVRRYVEEHRTAWVPAGYRDADGFALGKWASKRRSEHRKGRLDPSRAAALERLRGWAWKQRREHPGGRGRDG